jgi:hypothetical protein
LYPGSLILPKKARRRKRMRKTFVIALFALFVVASSSMASDTITVDLVADGGDVSTEVVVGTVTALYTPGAPGNLAVTYTITVGNWYLDATHLDVQTSLAGFPTNQKGNPKVGKFAEKMDHPVGTITYTYNISMTIAEDGIVCIAAHADVVDPDAILVDPTPGSPGSGDEYLIDREETAWGRGTEFVGDRGWAMYFPFEYNVIPD